MAESTRRTWQMRCARGVIGSSQGRPSFTVRMRKPPRARCAKLPRGRPPSSADGTTVEAAAAPRNCWRSEVKLESSMLRNVLRAAAVAAVVCVLVLAPGCRKKKYENPITKDTQQPDKVLFDRAVDDIEHARYEQARLTLQTLMNTYDTSEYLAKAKLAVADSWYREGGSHGLAQAEAEYK